MAKIISQVIVNLKLASIVLWLGFFPGAWLAAQVPEGIPRDLARQRAQQISDVRYHLSYTLTPHAPSVAGHEEIQFRLQSAGMVMLDFREGTIADAIVNGKAAVVKIENGHIQLPGELLQAGENKVSLNFTAPVAPAGKAITRFEDKDDGSEYIYTLFVPMDADMAFPCFDQPDIKAKFRLEVSTPQDWTVVSNTFRLGGSMESMGGVSIWHTIFAETKPIST